MRYFIDLGANDSCSTRIFRKLYDPKCKYRIYAFEPEPEFKDNFRNIKNCVFLPYAAWISETTLNFYRDVRDKRKAGGTLLLEKKGVSKHNDKMAVQGFDFSNWISTNFKVDDEIILKMDIEGAEYQVIPKMFDDDTLNYISKINIEWHWYKLEGVALQYHVDTESMIKDIPMIKLPGVEQAERILGKYYKKGIKNERKNPDRLKK